ncbi:MAG: DUF3375 family protein [Opitutaceae bacterium]|nr:DUF3375 family protein [Opitutaceae bacterium]
MNYYETQQRLEMSGALRVLKKDTAPLILGFLHAAFRADHAVARTEREMIARLTEYIERINEETGDTLIPGKAKDYLSQWCDPKFGVLKNRYNETLEVVYEITPDVDMALSFIEGSRRNFIGTESKLRTIAEKLQEIADNTDSDRHRRIDRLRAEREKLDNQIRELLRGDPVPIFSRIEVTERYQLVQDLALSLRRDFTVIRERFQQLARRIVEQHSAGGMKRGHVVRGAIDDELRLRESDEGQSFAAFQQFLLQPESQERFFDLIERVERLDVIPPDQREAGVLKNLPSVLLEEAGGVVETNRRLSSALRRVLDSVATSRRQETAAIIAEIKALAYALKDSPPEGPILDGPAEVNLEEAEWLNRVPWQAGDEISIPAEIGAAATGDPLEAAARLARLEHIDFARLKANIERAFGHFGNHFRLSEVFDFVPPTSERLILEILGYLALAAKNADWKVDHRVGHEFVASVPGCPVAYRVPQIYFYRAGQQILQ